MLRLTRGAMAQLRVQRLLPAQLKLHSSAVTVALKLRVKVLIWLVSSVRRLLLPLVWAMSSLLSSVILIHFRRTFRIGSMR